MVYIPTGAFYVGDRVGFVSQSPGHFVAGTTTKPFQITSEAELTIDSNATTELWGISNTGASTIGPVGTLPAQFPKGYQSFYIMKYELSQYMYKEFLNKLTQIQQNARASAITADRFMANTDTSIVPQYRNGIKVMSDPGGTLPRVYGNDLNNNGTEGEADDGQHIACNDLMAFAVWSGLRPFTELEYEKACRGTLNPTADECAWGTANMTFATGISNPDMANERATNAGANVNSNRELGVLGPMRCGSFAGMATNREQAGATYYGVMEMSGNLWEYAYSVGLVLSRSFNGNNHGDGFIAVSGNTNVADWPIRAGIRGGAWHDFVTYNALQVSSRYSASSAYTSGRHRSTGIRLVRTQP
jgi:formylglycine-generating enzyme required for sulfatase activity